MSKNRVEVVIGGSILSLQGDESEEHMQRVARVINDQLSEIQAAYNKNRLPVGKMNQLLVLNLADAYVKKQQTCEKDQQALQEAKTEIKELTANLEALTLQIAQMKEELASRQPHKKDHNNRGR